MNNKHTIPVLVVILLSFLSNNTFCQAKEWTRTDIDNAIAKFQDYDYATSPNIINSVEEIVRYAVNHPELKPYVEEKFIVLLQYHTSRRVKQFICQKLWVIGSDKSIPILQKLLLDPQSAEIACFALRSNTSVQASATLRNSLAQVPDETKIRIINILGDRRDEASIKILADLMKSARDQVSSAAARALGKIGGAQAASFLEKARKRPRNSQKKIYDDAYLQCGQSFLEKNENGPALKIFKELFAERKSPLIHRAALMGIIQTGGPEALQQVIQVLHGNDSELKAAAIANSFYLKSAGATQALIDSLDRLDTNDKVLLITALAKRHVQRQVLTTITRLAGSDQPAVRLAAINALGNIGTLDTVKLLAKISSNNASTRERNAATASLRKLNAPGVEEAIIREMTAAEPKVRPTLIKIISDRMMQNGREALILQCRAPQAEVRKAAYRALGKLAGHKDVPALLESLRKYYNKDIARTAERAIIAAAKRENDDKNAATFVIAALAEEKRTPVKCSLIRILGGIAGKDALSEIARQYQNLNPIVCDTALRELADWPDPAALSVLYNILQKTADNTQQVLVLRGYIRLLAIPTDRDTRDTIAKYKAVLKYARRTEDKKLLLSGLAKISDPQALTVVKLLFDDPDVKNEADLTLTKLLKKTKPISLFNGKNFDGWQGDPQLFRIEDGAIVGGSLQKPIPHNAFLSSRKSFNDFELHLKVKLLGNPQTANAGIQIRSRRIPGNYEMIGYQADMGQQYWGCLYDESRRRKVLATCNRAELDKVLKLQGWNDYIIRAVGRRIQLWINGYQTVDYIELDDGIEQSGLIGLQIHAGAPSEAWYKDIVIKEIP